MGKSHWKVGSILQSDTIETMESNFWQLKQPISIPIISGNNKDVARFDPSDLEGIAETKEAAKNKLRKMIGESLDRGSKNKRGLHFRPYAERK